MGRFESTIEVKSPPEEAFRFIADGTNSPQWHPSMRKAERVVEGPLQLGSKPRVEAVVGHRKYSWEQEVVEWVPNKSYRDRMVVGPFKKFEDWAEFQKSETGTKWTFGLEYELPGIIGRVLDLFMRKRVRQHHLEAMRRAKDILESQRSARERSIMQSSW
jgi:ribosome-associated toxin RatA of RatAB toxin-antitoxin module